MKHVAFRLVTFTCLALLFLASSTFAKQDSSPEIKDIIVTTSETDLLLFATVKNGFTGRMLEDLENGIPIEFVYQLELVMTGNRFFDTTLVESTITHTLLYDETAKIYRITFSEAPDRPLSTTDLSEAKQLMAELNGVKIIPLKKLVLDAPYAIHFKVTLQKGALPLGMHRFLPFSSLWNFETDWRTIEFRY
ncbi:MAG: DUF4390 domain-containing protein [Desulfobulbus sp.]|nr:DUF4390 domain-containing protein [Desulfobulbus sp.]